MEDARKPTDVHGRLTICHFIVVVQLRHFSKSCKLTPIASRLTFRYVLDYAFPRGTTRIFDTRCWQISQSGFFFFFPTSLVSVGQIATTAVSTSFALSQLRAARVHVERCPTFHVLAGSHWDRCDGISTSSKHAIDMCCVGSDGCMGVKQIFVSTTRIWYANQNYLLR